MICNSHLSLATAAAAAGFTVGGLILALREFKIGNGSSFSWLSGRGGRSERPLLVPGLQNLGNNCFLNVILQALSSCSGFRQYLNNIIEQYDTLLLGQVKLLLPLTVAVSDLMEELNITRDRKVVLSPRQVMYAVESYNANFSLAVQQDAAEAFLHLMSSLREEVSETYVPNNGSLLDASAVPCRIFDAMSLVAVRNEHKRWKELYVGPFDGISGNILTCRSCSSQIMMDYEFFHILPLLPVSGMGTSIFYGCSLELCLKQYIASDEVEGYKCDNCWHVAALRCLSETNGNEADIDKLKYCSGQEKCDCRFLPGLDSIPVPISRAFRQLNIARCPKILCIQLLRATTNLFGDLIKLEGHISFPLILNLSPFMRNRVDMEHISTASRRLANDYGQQRHPLWSMNSNKQISTGVLSHTNFPHQTKQLSDTSVDKQLVSLGDHGNKEVMNTNTEQKDRRVFQCEDSSQPRPAPGNVLEQHQEKVRTEMVNIEHHAPIPMYRLVSVVEHVGKTGGGHYTIYRKQIANRDEVSCRINLVSTDQWFLISDSDVIPVSEREVLSAQASILFYERISES